MELDAAVLSQQPDAEEEITPIRATECGLLWLNFKSEPVWEAVSKLAINSSDTTQTLDRELSFRFSKTLRLEFEIEYAVDPVRLLQRQYRVHLEINTRWKTTRLVFGDWNTQPSCLRTPWTTLTEQTFSSRASYSPTKTSQLPELFRMDSALSSNAVSCIEYPDDSTSRDEPMSRTTSADGLYQHLCLPLDCTGDTLFAGKPMLLINPDTYSPDEVGLPIPAHKRALIHLLESHI
ncbi:hypothetical protein EG68_10753 [Paragonimus skrjabini miyazakii]|uniref:Uncharacterized protein n=1 Tax=Paragonimus skrjabini miyazakii TaxID=59628 RepID=A0A8S9YJQ7_9TREM|nr:hypothetical protein EG68_10753 [Paragonimus skrjabini miyazakii]